MGGAERIAPRSKRVAVLPTTGSCPGPSIPQSPDPSCKSHLSRFLIHNTGLQAPGTPGVSRQHKMPVYRPDPAAGKCRNYAPVWVMQDVLSDSETPPTLIQMISPSTVESAPHSHQIHMHMTSNASANAPHSTGKFDASGYRNFRCAFTCLRGPALLGPSPSSVKCIHTLLHLSGAYPASVTHNPVH